MDGGTECRVAEPTSTARILTPTAHAACGRAGLPQALLIIGVANSQIRSAATAAQPNAKKAAQYPKRSAANPASVVLQAAPTACSVMTAASPAFTCPVPSRMRATRPGTATPNNPADLLRIL